MQRLNKGGSLGGLRRTNTYGIGGGENADSILSETVTLGELGYDFPTLAPSTILSLTIPVTSATQHVLAIFDAQLDATEASATQGLQLTMRLDGTISDARAVTLTATGSWTGFSQGPMHALYTVLTVGTHTIDVQGQASNAVFSIAAGRARLTLVRLPG